MRHTILGAGGAVGNALAYELLKTNQPMKLVSRSNYTIKGAESVKADLTSYRETLDSIQNTDVAYLCAGLTYDSKVWTDIWPKIMKTTIDACKIANVKLVFFDNVYMYGKVRGKMTEETLIDPCSKKGDIRAQIALMLEKEFYKRDMDALIARSADIYGPHATKTSLLYILVLENLVKGKKAQWIVDAEKLHSFTYTLDCARGMILLAANEKCYNQVWHLPTYDPPITGKKFIEIAAKELGVAPEYSVLKKRIVKIAGFFDKTIHESFEMIYQSESDYLFDSTKFNKFFDYYPVSYEQGIHETVEFL
jgi:nucleoside-diphosphate-sugar epimerase